MNLIEEQGENNIGIFNNNWVNVLSVASIGDNSWGTDPNFLDSRRIEKMKNPGSFVELCFYLCFGRVVGALAGRRCAVIESCAIITTAANSLPPRCPAKCKRRNAQFLPFPWHGRKAPHRGFSCNVKQALTGTCWLLHASFPCSVVYEFFNSLLNAWIEVLLHQNIIVCVSYISPILTHCYSPCF